MAKLNSGGTQVWATYLGGNKDDWGSGIVLDSSDNFSYICGSTDSTDFAGTSYGGYDAFVVQVNSSGSMVRAVRLGGSGDDYGYAIAWNPTTTFPTSQVPLFVTGSTKSTNFAGHIE